MAEQARIGFGPLSPEEFETEMKRLVRDLAFYARGPVRIHLVGGDHIAYTFNTEDKLHSINIVLNPSKLEKVRHKGRAIAILRGIGFHELAHHLWPAEAQYKIANAEGFMSLLNLVDDEQNERRGRALDPKWGACFQTVCAYIFPSRRKKAGTIDVGIEDGDSEGKAPAKERKPEGLEAHEAYARRWNEFAYHFRRHMPNAETDQVIRALALIPADFKDISKEDLLSLTRRIHETLGEGIELPKPAKREKEETEEEEAGEEPLKGGEKLSPDSTGGIFTKSFWRGLFHSKWTYVAMAAAVLLWGLIFVQSGSDFWNEVFWYVVGILFTIGGFIGLRALLRRIQDNAAERSLNIRSPSFLKKMLVSTRDAVGEFFGSCFRWAIRPFKGWPIWAWLGKWLGAFFRFLGRIISATASAIKRGWFKLWDNRYFRIVLIATVPAVWLVMLWGVFTHAAEISWVYVVILAIWLLAMLALVWFFREKLKDFLLGEFSQDMSFPYNFHVRMEMDKETLEFNVVENVVAVQADHDYLAACTEELFPLARQLRRQLSRCGSSLKDHDGQPDGYDFIEELELLHMGESAVFVDDEEEQKASLHVEVAVDCSSSMLSANETLKEGEKFDMAKKFALLVEMAIQNHPGMSGRFWGFTDTCIYDCGTAGEGRISGLVCAGGNNDSAMLWHMGQSAARSDKTVKLLFMLSDGQPSDCSWGSLNNLVIKFEGEGMIPWQFALDKIDDPAFQRYFTDLCGQPMAEAIMTMGRTLASLAEGL